MTTPARRTWIMGASAGIGAALAQELAARGESIALSARSAAALADIHTTLPPQDHLIVPCDVTDQTSVIAAHQQITEKWDTLDRVIFMAGIYEPMSLAHLDLEDTRRMIEVNLMGAFHLVNTILPSLLATPNGQIALCGSIGGYRGLPNAQPYAATKAGLHSLAETLKAEYAGRLDVKLISPGFVETRLTAKNTFTMPMMISAQQAAHTIADGLATSAFEVHFPKRFSLSMKLLNLLPYRLYFWLLARGVGRKDD